MHYYTLLTLIGNTRDETHSKTTTLCVSL